MVLEPGPGLGGMMEYNVLRVFWEGRLSVWFVGGLMVPSCGGKARGVSCWELGQFCGFTGKA